MGYPHQLENFLVGYMESQGALCDRPSYGIVEMFAEMPDDLQKSGAQHFSLAFDYEASQEVEGAEFISYGHPLYERIAANAVSKHFYTERYVSGTDGAPNNLQKKLMQQLNLSANLEILHKKQYFARAYRLSFKCSFLSEQREESIENVWIDGFSSTEIPYQSVHHIFVDESDRPCRLLPELPPQSMSLIFVAALKSLRKAADARRATIESESKHLASGDRERTQKYFQTMLDEALSKLNKAADAATKQDAEAKIGAIESQRQHHLQDIEARYQIACEVSLLDIVCYVVPRWRVKYRDNRRHVQNKGVETVYWDEILKSFLS